MWGSARLVVVTSALFAALVAPSGPVAAISAKPSSADFGPTPLGAMKSKTFAVKLDPGYSFGGVSGAASAPFATTGACTAGACKFTESFNPTMIGTYDTVLTVTECRTAAAIPCVFMHLPMHGVGGVFTAKPVALGSVAISRTKSKTFAIKLDAGYTMGALGGAGNQAPFAAANAGCVGGVCKVTETFAPAQPGDFDVALSLSECASGGGACNTIALDVSARGR